MEIIDNIEKLRELKGEVVCFKFMPPHTVNCSMKKELQEFYWRVGELTPRPVTGEWDRQVVCWHYDYPDFGVCVRDFNVIQNNYNNHLAYLISEKITVRHPNDIVLNVEKSYIKPHITKENHERYKARMLKLLE